MGEESARLSNRADFLNESISIENKLKTYHPAREDYDFVATDNKIPISNAAQRVDGGLALHLGNLPSWTTSYR